MTNLQRSLASLALQLLQRGKSIEQTYAYITNTRQGINPDDIGIAMEYASRAYDWGMSAQSGRYERYNQIPGSNFGGGDVRVRLYIEGEGKQGAVQGVIDVIVGQNDPISAVYEYGFAQLNDWLEQYPGKGRTVPRSRLRGGDAVRIELIQPENASFTESKITYQGV